MRARQSQVNRVRDTKGSAVRALASACLLAALAGFAPASYAQVPELDAVATEAAAAIGRNARNAKVFVWEFKSSQGGQSQLGVALADEFETALEKEAQGFILLERDDTMARRATETGDAGECRARPEADIDIQGTIENLPGTMAMLRIQVLKKQKVIFHDSVKAAIPAEMLRGVYEEEALPDTMRGKMLWTNEKREGGQTQKPIRLTKKKADASGYTLVQCIRCPYADFSREALQAKRQGTVVFDVEVDETGRPVAISVVTPLPCGLTDSALGVVKGWKLEPAKGPDGKAMAAIVAVEVTFRLY